MSAVSKVDWPAILAELTSGRASFVCHAAAHVAGGCFGSAFVAGKNSELHSYVQSTLESDGITLGGAGFDDEAPLWVWRLGDTPHARRIAYVKRKIAESE